MKNYISFSFLIFNASLLLAGESGIKISVPVEEVTIFLRGVEVNRRKPVSLVPGRNQFVFRGISSKLIPKRIQAKAPEDISRAQLLK